MYCPLYDKTALKISILCETLEAQWDEPTLDSSSLDIQSACIPEASEISQILHVE